MGYESSRSSLSFLVLVPAHGAPLSPLRYVLLEATMLALRRTLPTVSRRVARCMSTAAAEASDGSMTLNFSLPHETIYSEAKVSQVIVPGAAGEYGITADHVPIVAQLKPGVLQIMHEGAEPEKYFVAGGFSLTHDNSVTVRLLPWLLLFFVLIFVFQITYFRIQ